MICISFTTINSIEEKKNRSLKSLLVKDSTWYELLLAPYNHSYIVVWCPRWHIWGHERRETGGYGWTQVSYSFSTVPGVKHYRTCISIFQITGRCKKKIERFSQTYQKETTFHHLYFIYNCQYYNYYRHSRSTESLPARENR